MYSDFTANYNAALKTLTGCKRANKKFRKYLQEVQQPACGGLTLESLLIKPVQRICKYPLLFDSILKHTAKVCYFHLVRIKGRDPAFLKDNPSNNAVS